MGSPLVFADRATAETHLEILEAAAAAEAACELMILTVSGIAPESASGWKIIGLAPDYSYKVRRQVVALNAAVYRPGIASTSSVPPPWLEP